MKIFLKIFTLLVLIILFLLLIAVLRTLLLKKKSTEFSFSKDIDRSMEYGKKLQTLVRFETESSRGNPQIEKFRTFHKVLESQFPHVFEKCEKFDIDGNLMMKWKGKDPSMEPIILISHQDVVPAEGMWTYPPYSGHISEDYRIYGRGAGDIKSGLFSFYQAAEELIASGYEPECDVYLGSSCTEEIGGDGAPKMRNWFKEHGVHLFMLCDEGGGIVKNPVASVNGTFAAVGIFEKGYGDLKFIAKSNGGHSSTPGKNLPIARLAKMISEIDNHNPFKVEFSPAVDAMFHNIAPYSDSFVLRMVMYNLWLFKPILKKVIPNISKEAAAMLQTTVCFTMQKGSNAANVIPQEAWAIANLRYIPFEGLEQSNAKLTSIAKKYDIETEFVQGNDSSKALNLDGQAYAFTSECIKKIFPGIGLMPYVVTGGTDSRFFDEVCDNCVRFSPICTEPDQLKSMHGIDENIFITTLPDAVDYYKEIIQIQEKRKGC